MIDSKKIMGLVIVLLIMGVMIPIGINLYEEQNLEEFTRTDLSGSAFNQNKTYLEERSENETFDVNLPFGSSDSANVYVDFTPILNNYTDIIEDSNTDVQTNVKDNCLFQTFIAQDGDEICNVSIGAQQWGASVGYLKIYIIPSVWDSANSRSKINTSFSILKTQNITSMNFPVGLDWWNNVSFTYTIDNSLTQNNTWFLGIFENAGTSDIAVWQTNDATNGDNATCYSSTQLGSWTYTTIDFYATIGISEITNRLSINGTNIPISDTYSFSYGASDIIEFTLVYSGSDLVDFNITFDIIANDEEFKMFEGVDIITINTTINNNTYHDCSLYLTIINISSIDELASIVLSIDGELILFALNDTLIISDITLNSSILIEFATLIATGEVDFEISAYYLCTNENIVKVNVVLDIIPIIFVIGIMGLFIFEYIKNKQDE